MTELTDRHRVILDLLAEGMVVKQVAAYMGRSPETVKDHLADARRVLGARNTTHAVAIYLRSKRMLPADGRLVRRDDYPALASIRQRYTDTSSSPRGYPKGPAAPSSSPEHGAPLVHWLAFRLVDGARKFRVVL